MDRVFNPDEEQDPWKWKVSNHPIQKEGVFVQKNHNIAPHYREYKEEVAKVRTVLSYKNRELARARRDWLVEAKLEADRHHLQRWEIYRQVENDRIDQEVAQKRRQKLYTLWVASALCSKIVRAGFEHMTESYLELLKTGLRRIKVHTIARCYLLLLRRQGATFDARLRRGVQCAVNFNALLKYDHQQEAARGVLHAVLLDASKRFALKVRIKRYFEVVAKVQRALKAKRANRGDRYLVVAEAISKKIQSMLMKTSKKSKKQEKQLRSIAAETRHQVIARYLQFCSDQALYKQLLYRRTIARAKLGYKFLLGIAIRRHSRARHEGYRLREEWTDALVAEPERLGRPVDLLIPCLDPDLPESKRKANADLACERYVEGGDPIFELDLSDPEQATPGFLGEHYPDQLAFYPSEEVQKKLIMRMVQCGKKWERDLWQGFRPVEVNEERLQKLGLEKPEFTQFCHEDNLFYYTAGAVTAF